MELTGFEAFVQKQQLFSKTDGVLVACSGGADSVVLCHLLFTQGYKFAIAHCNFQLRGTESNRDEAFVRLLAEQYQAPLFVRHFETQQYADAKKLSIQVAARELRYAWFYSLLNSDFSLLATAHHADDNIETVMMNFFKGTGISGLHGILPKKDQLVRPLLFARKQQLLDYANAHGLQWVEDSSNASDKYTRNFFRHQIVPLVEQVIPAAAQNVLANIERLTEVETVYKQAMEAHQKKLVEVKGSEWHIPVFKLAKCEPVASVLYEIIKSFGFTARQLPDALALLEAETGRYIASTTHRLIRNRNWLIIAPVVSTEARNILIEDSNTAIAFAEGMLVLQQLANTDKNIAKNSDATVAVLDARNIRFPLLLRPWKEGDYFYPLGMPKKKKIARFLIDKKVSKTDKEKIWVLENDQRIIWVVGQRIDDRFKLTDNTEKVLEIKWQPSSNK